MLNAPSGREVLRNAITGQSRYVLGASALASGHQAGEALIPVLIGVVIDQAVSTGNRTSLIGWLIALAAVFAGLSSCYRFASRTSERASEQAGHRIRIDLTKRVLDARGGAEAGHLPGELVNIATGDARRVGTVNAVLPFGFAALMGLLVSAVALLRMSIPLGLLVLLGAPPLLWLTHLVGKPLERRSGHEQQRAAAASGVAADLLSGLRVLKGIGAESAAIARYRKASQDSKAATVRSAGAQAWHDGALLAFTGIFIALVALVGGRLAASGTISIGDLVAAVGLAQFLLGPLSVFTFVNGEIAKARASAARVAAVLAAPHAITSGTDDPPYPSQGHVRFSAVSHRNLRGLDLEIAQGELLGVVTTDHASGTDLLECLGRQADPASGVIELDGAPLSTVDSERLRSVILVAAHDATLFEGTVLDNVTTADSAPVEPALRAAGADEVARALPNGLDTVLTEHGRSLSGGQRQRVALARALAADPPVLVVHDPTTAVDAVTEARIASRIKDFRSERTTIVITTSPALLAVTDRVVVLHEGTVTDSGQHTELVRNKRYRSAVLA